MTAAAAVGTAAVGGMAVIGLLWRIAWTSARLLQAFDDHVMSDRKIQADHEDRLRVIEGKDRRRRG
jgi:hypothetical protein